MVETFLLIEENQVWFYLSLLLVGLLYLRQVIRWTGELRRAVFSLERERALSMLRRATAMLALVVVGELFVFLIVTLVTPTLPPTASTPAAAPAFDAPQPTIEQISQATAATSTPLEGINPFCPNPEIMLTSPQDGETLDGVITVEGTASIVDFGFYKFEYRGVNPDAVWRSIAAGLEPRQDQELGTWDTTLVPSGEYQFRLVVSNAEGIAQEPCLVNVRILNP